MIFKIINNTREFFRRYLFYYKIIEGVKQINAKLNSETKYLEQHYRTSKLFLPRDSRWRQYRFWMKDGRCIKIKDQIRDEKTLRYYLLKYVPVHATYSASAYLNPKNFGRISKKSNIINENLFLYNDIIFDIDVADLKKAQTTALFIIDYMRKKEQEPEYIVFSGSRGFHITYIDNKKYDDPDPRIREAMCGEERKKLMNELTPVLIKAGLRDYWDSSILINTRGSVRLPKTINCKTGRACWPVTEQDLKKPVAEMLKKIPKLKKVPKPLNTDIVEPLTMMKLRTFLDRQQERAALEYTAFFVSNKISNSDSVIFLRYKSHILPEVISDIGLLQKKYSLGNFYLFRTELKDEYYAICPEIVHSNKFRKIVKSSKCMHRQVLERQPEAFIRISSKRFPNGKRSSPIDFLRIIKSKNSQNIVSSAHVRLLYDMGVKRINYEKEHYRMSRLIIYHDKIIDSKLMMKKIVPYNAKIVK